jgi:hypothetical protein
VACVAVAQVTLNYAGDTVSIRNGAGLFCQAGVSF